MFSLVLFFLCNYINGNKIISEQFVLKDRLPSISLSMPYENYNRNTYLNTYISYSLFDIEDFMYISEKGDNMTLKLYRSYRCYKYNTSIVLFKQNQVNFSYNIAIFDNYQYYIEDIGLALGYSFENDSYSLVHSLYNKGLIEQHQFSFEWLENGGIFHIGGIKNDNYTYKGYCDIKDNHTTWGCDLNQIVYGHTIFNVSYYGVFHTGSTMFFLSENFFHFMTTHIFPECIVNKRSNEIETLDCDPFILDDLSDRSITFIFNNLMVNISLELMFTLEYGKMKSKFYSFPLDIDSNTVILGNIFLKLFNLTQFDYDGKRVIFYSDFIPMKMTQIPIKGSPILFYIIILICLVNSIMLLFIKINYR